MSQEKIKRNKKIYKFWKDGPLTISEIARKFDLAPEVAWRIVKRYSKKEGRR
jgi:DNA-binding Lrp family transcriptional regulator